MYHCSIVYFNNETIKEEFEIEDFWKSIRQEIYTNQEDDSDVSFKTRRAHQSAFAGEYAGIFAEYIISGIALIDSSISIWQHISEHLKEKRAQKKVVRVIDLCTLENLCSYDLIANKKVKDAKIIKSKVLTMNYEKVDGYDSEFIYSGEVTVEDAASITFENKKEKFKYKIQTDGNIIEFKRLKK